MYRPRINPDDFLQTPSGRVWTPERSRQAWEQAYDELRATLASLVSEAARAGPPPKLYIVCGIQGAGKSTWIRNNSERLAPCVFFDAALPKAKHRAPLVDMARQAGITVCAVWVDTPLATALARNARRSEDTRVPESSILSVADQFERPTLAEGLDEVIELRGDGNT